MPINVFIGNGQNIVRKGLRLLLENELDVTVVGEADNGNSCIIEVNKLKPNIVILDMNLENMDATKTLKEMREQSLNVKILLLASDNELDKLHNVIDAGCDGFLLKSCEVYELKNAIYSLYQGNTYIQNSLRDGLHSSIMIKNSSEDKISELTHREVEILSLVAEGLLNKEIGQRLSISERTVKNHVSSIFKKIQVSDRTQAAVFAIKNNLITI